MLEESPLYQSEYHNSYNLITTLEKGIMAQINQLNPTINLQS